MITYREEKRNRGYMVYAEVDGKQVGRWLMAPKGTFFAGSGKVVVDGKEVNTAKLKLGNFTKFKMYIDSKYNN